MFRRGAVVEVLSEQTALQKESQMPGEIHPDLDLVESRWARFQRSVENSRESNTLGFTNVLKAEEFGKTLATFYPNLAQT